MSDGWEEHGVCRQTDPEIFFPEPGQSGMAKQAVKVCMGCTVREECAARGLGDDGGDPERDGVWGGLTVMERRRILRHRSRWPA